MTLPTPAEFMANEGIGTPTLSGGGGSLGKAPVKVPGVSEEFKGLLIQYCAKCLDAHDLESVRWNGLAVRLGTQAEFLREAARVVDQALAEHGGLWTEVLAARIKSAHAAKIFRDSSWERLEQMAVGKLVDLAERGAIRDPGELLAIAQAARRTNEGPSSGASGGSHTSITINNANVGADSMGENGLPPAGAKMTIDLSPRLATALSQRGGEVAPHGQRVIDGEMISAKTLRAELESRHEQEAEAVSEERDSHE